jgi:uncharacterized membrane protein YdbT with pleckstrin-like domain
MAYYKMVLQPDENVKYVGKLHWMIHRHAIVLAALAVISAVIYSSLSRATAPIALVAIAAFVASSVISYVRTWFTKVTTEIVVTDKRVIHKVGWIARHTEEMNISKVETVDVDQGIGGRILGFGTVLIRGIGGSWEPLRWLSSPLELRNAIIVG